MKTLYETTYFVTFGLWCTYPHLLLHRLLVMEFRPLLIVVLKGAPAFIDASGRLFSSSNGFSTDGTG